MINSFEKNQESIIYKINKDTCKVYTKMLKLSWQRYNVNFGIDKI